MLSACGLLVGGLEWLRRSRDFSDTALLERVPTEEGVTAYLNVKAMRQSGWLDAVAGSRTNEDAEYQAFVGATGFDYREDLTTVVAHLGLERNLFVLRGRFDWNQISGYLRGNGGKCLNSVCGMETKKGQFVSVMPLAPDILAVGTGLNDRVVYEANNIHARGKALVPSEPFWVELSRAFLQDPRHLPAGTRAFITTLAEAQRVVVALGQDAQGTTAIEARMQASFATEPEAAAQHLKLEETTAMLRKFFSRDRQQPNSGGLSGVLTAGRFARKQTVVTGVWPMDRAVFESLFGGPQPQAARRGYFFLAPVFFAAGAAVPGNTPPC